MTCVSCMVRIARQTTFFLFPILIIPVLGMESPRRDPRPPTLPTTIHAGPDSTHDESAYHIPISRMDAIPISPELPRMRHPTISRHHPYTPFLASFWNSHSGRPNYAPHRRTVLHHIDMRHITLHMPYNDPQSENQKDSKMSHLLYTKLPHFALFVRKFYFGHYFTH